MEQRAKVCTGRVEAYAFGEECLPGIHRIHRLEEKKDKGGGDEERRKKKKAGQVILNQKMDPSIFTSRAPWLQRPLARRETGPEATARFHTRKPT